MQLTQTQIDTFRRCLMRELKFRERVYSKWVIAGKMTQEQADFEIETMEKMKDYFDWLQIHTEPQQQKLF